MPRIKPSKTRLRLWTKNPHCFWCGKLTVLYEGTHFRHDRATIDHIRSRFAPERSEREGKWQPGILVLACGQCNQERSNYEQAWLAENKPEIFHKKGSSLRADRYLLRIQSRLCNAVLYHLEHGGAVEGTRATSQIKGLGKLLRLLYDKRKEAKRRGEAFVPVE